VCVFRPRLFFLAVTLVSLSFYVIEGVENHSAQNLLSSRLLSENVKVRIHRTNFACDSIWV
jgi:hypothetical protein